MRQRPVRAIVILLATCALVIACKDSSQSEDPFASQEKENSTFAIRIIGFRERRTFGQALGGASYVFETKARSEPAWKRFMVYKYDDPIPIDKSAIGFVNETVGYVFMIDKLAVTTNGGMNWSTWDTSKIESRKDDLSCKIQKVGILQDGTGTLNIKCDKTSLVVSTNDFGATWK